MKTSATQFLHQWPMMSRSEKKSRSRSTQPARHHTVAHGHGGKRNVQIQNSNSQPMLHIPCNTLPRRAGMLTAPAMISLSNQLSDMRLDTQRSEKFTQDDVVMDEDGHILSGSSEALIKRLIPTHNFQPDANYMFALLINIRTVMSPEEVMQKIVQHCMFSQNADAGNFAREGRDRMFSHILRLCTEWATVIPYDFRSEHMRTRLNELLGLCSVDRSYKQKVTELQSSLKSALNKLDRYEKAAVNLLKTLSETHQRPSQHEILTGLITVSQDPRVVAHQLTHIEMERFSMVGIEEIIVALANNDLSELGRDKGKAHSFASISFYVEWFNRLSSFAATEVLRQMKKKHRVEVIEFLIDVAKECCEIGNFNSLMAIVAGLSLPAVARLKRTWCRVEKAKLEILQHQLDPSGNFLSYRATMKAAQWRADSARKADHKIVIPFFVLLLKDLFLIYHGHHRVLANGHLNFVAYQQLAEQLRNVVSWKSTPCTFPKHPHVLQYLLVSSIYGERESMLVSFESEAAESSVEREQFKKLKVATK